MSTSFAGNVDSIMHAPYRADDRAYLFFPPGSSRPTTRILTHDVSSVRQFRDKNYPDHRIYVLDHDYSMTREIINIDTGETMEYFI